MRSDNVGRNDPCRCGSGKKFKKCCLLGNSRAWLNLPASKVGRAAPDRPIPLATGKPRLAEAGSAGLPRSPEAFWCGDDPADEPIHLDPSLVLLLPVEVAVGYSYPVRAGLAEVTYIYPAGRTVCLVGGDYILNEDLRPGMRAFLGGGTVALITEVSPIYDLPQPPCHQEDGTTISRVVGTIKHANFQVIDVRWRGGSVTGSPDHLFYSYSRGRYVQARELEPGEFLRSGDGRPVPVEGVSGARYGQIDLYNVEVEHYHNYFVSDGRVPGVLVHNGTECIQTLRTFDLVDQLKGGSTLLIGEGNFSFAKSLAQKQGINPADLTATEYTAEASLSTAAQQNVTWLRDHGARVMCGVDAQNLSATLGASTKYAHIVWNFPFAHAGPGRANINAVNRTLMSAFFSSAAGHLTTNGSVIFTLHDPYFQNWKVADAARAANLSSISQAPYQLSNFSGYQPMTTYRNVTQPNWSTASTYIFQRGR